MIVGKITPTDFEDVPDMPVLMPGRTPSESAAPRSARKFPDSFRLLDDVQLLELPDPEWLVEGVVPRRGTVVIYGPSGGCKTTLVASLLTSLATGQPWFGHAVKHRGNSVYVASEDVSGFKIRLAAAKRAARLSLDQPIGIYTFPEPIDLRDPVSVGRFTDLHQRPGRYVLRGDRGGHLRGGDTRSR